MRISLAIATMVLGISQLLSAQAPIFKTITPTGVVKNSTVLVTVTGSRFKKGMSVVYDGYKYYGVTAKVINQYKATATLTVQGAETAKIHLTYKGDLSNVLPFNVFEPLKITPQINVQTLPDGTSVTLIVVPDQK